MPLEAYKCFSSTKRYLAERVRNSLGFIWAVAFSFFTTDYAIFMALLWYIVLSLRGDYLTMP